MGAWGSTVYAKRNGVHLAYRVAEGEGPDVVRVLVSSAVPPLVAGSGLAFEARHRDVELKGVADTWTLFSPT